MDSDWIKIKKKQISDIKGFKPKDRLDMVRCIALMNTHIATSCQGWSQWLLNPAIISQFDEKDLRIFYDHFKKISLDFLGFDVEASGKLKPSKIDIEKKFPYG